MSPKARRERRAVAERRGRSLQDRGVREQALHDAQLYRLRDRMYSQPQQLLAAAAGGDAALFQRLAKADPGLLGLKEVLDSDGRNPLHIAAAAGHLPVLRACLRERNDAQQPRSAVLLSPPAAGSGVLVGRRLREQRDTGDETHAKTTARGLTLLHCAVLSGRLAVVEWVAHRLGDAALLQALTSPTTQGKRPSDLADLYAFNHILKFLQWQTKRLEEADRRSRASSPFSQAPQQKPGDFALDDAPHASSSASVGQSVSRGALPSVHGDGADGADYNPGPIGSFNKVQWSTSDPSLRPMRSAAAQQPAVCVSPH